jgi:NitT/TauT family transport system permease protein
MSAPPSRSARVLVPIGVIALTLLVWQIIVALLKLPPYILPSPIEVGAALSSDWTLLSGSLWITLQVAAMALFFAVVFGVLLALIMSQSRWLELIFFPYMVVMQVTPIIAIAPLIIIWVSNLKVGVLICTWLVTFFPIVSNTATGLKSVDRGLEDLFRLYGASRWQVLWELRLPAAMPYFLAGLRISGGLALIGTIAAEFVAGAGGQGSGLAFQILQAGYQMNIPRQFAAVTLVFLSGLFIHLALSLVSHRALHRWHESALKQES